MNIKKYCLSCISIIVAVLILLPHGVYAADAINGVACVDTGVFSTAGGITAAIMNFLINLCSWAWVILAFLAGKLMSNDWIYASGLHLDKTLYALWNYMKNFANFAIGFILVRKILQSIISLKDNGAEVKKILPNLLISTVLVNASWFMMGVLIDFSNVATAAVGSLPQMFFQENTISETTLKEALANTPDRIVIKNGCEGITPANTVEQKTPQNIDDGSSMDAIRARFNDMSGPLLFMGTSIFKFQNYSFTSDSVQSIKDLNIETFIKLIIMIMFLMPIAGLFFVNLKRVFYLWTAIIFGPFIVLLNDKLGLMKAKNIPTSGITAMFDIKELIGLIFTPIFTIAGLSIVLILSSSIFTLLGGKTKGTTSQVFEQMEIRNSSAGSVFNNTSMGTEVRVEGDLFNQVADYAGGFFGYMILVAFTIVLLWGVLKISVSSSKIASSAYEGVFKMGSSLIMSAPIVPLGNEKVTMKSLTDVPKNLTEKANTWINQKRNNDDGDGQSQVLRNAFYNTKLGKTMSNALGIDNSDPYSKDLSEKNQLELGQKVLNYDSKRTTFSNFGNDIKGYLDGLKMKKNLSLDGSSNKFQSFIGKTMLANNNLAEGLPESHRSTIKNKLDTIRSSGKTDEEKQNDATKYLFDISQPEGKAFIQALYSQLNDGKQLSTGEIRSSTTIYGISEKEPEKKE